MSVPGFIIRREDQPQVSFMYNTIYKFLWPEAIFCCLQTSNL